MTTRTRKAARSAVTSLKKQTHRTFSSLKLRNYRLYFIGQTISLCGTWMQSVTQALLVLTLAGPNDVGIALGIVMGLQFAPVLVLAPFGGVLADRFPKRRILFITQTMAGLLALTLGVLVATGSIRVWMLYLLAFGLGVVNAIDNPARQTFVHEMVGRAQLSNAVMLNSITVNLSRVIGPAAAGLVVAQLGLAPCFIINGLSFGAVLVCLGMMRDGELRRSAPVKAAKGQLREGFHYAWNTRILRDVLIMMVLIGTLTYEFSVSLPLLAHVTFAGPASQVAAGVATLMAVMGVGAVIGGLVAAGRHGATVRALTVGAFGFGISVLLVAVSPTLEWASLAMGVVGYYSVIFTSYSNALLQVSSEPRMRGRVMSLWTMAFVGMTVVGAPIVGWIGQVAGPRCSLVVGAAAAIVAGFVGLDMVRSHVRAPIVMSGDTDSMPAIVSELGQEGPA
ncbi:MAG TPA: MFS transporter [Coriobacteriia bacterium]